MIGCWERIDYEIRQTSSDSALRAWTCLICVPIPELSPTQPRAFQLEEESTDHLRVADCAILKIFPMVIKNLWLSQTDLPGLPGQSRDERLFHPWLSYLRNPLFFILFSFEYRGNPPPITNKRDIVLQSHRNRNNNQTQGNLNNHVGQSVCHTQTQHNTEHTIAVSAAPCENHLQAKSQEVSMRHTFQLAIHVTTLHIPLHNHRPLAPSVVTQEPHLCCLEHFEAWPEALPEAVKQPQTKYIGHQLDPAKPSHDFDIVLGVSFFGSLTNALTTLTLFLMTILLYK
ncbi:hypothetical protein CCUS01_00915 [Colletotrichum cuscutae]|uniref:Uncharacterized protein n=1 Tax=Colletotrichum cuscutae TaxID=1209917 RepID=A0AAI9V8A7_9PEZI|nr:hypothetical protein CCUS01_00915 [Colletotrichum cuscutae]